MKKSEIENWPKVTLMVGKWPQDLDPDHLLQGGGGGGSKATLILRGSQGRWAHSGTGAWSGEGQDRPGLGGAEPDPVGAGKQGRGVISLHSPGGCLYL